MAQNTIDSLQIQIAANANVAVSSLNKLSESLLRLKTSLGGISNGQFQDLSNGIRQMSEAMQRFSGTVKTADFTRIATGLNKLSSVNVQGVSNAARAINTLTANLSQIGTISFDSRGITNIAKAVAKLGRGTVTQAATNIPVLTTSLKGLADGLKGLKIENFDFENLERLTTSITKMGSKSATAAADKNIVNLAKAVKEMMTVLSTAPKVSQNVIQMAQSLAQLAANGTRAGTAARGLASNLNVYTNSSKKATLSTFSLAAAIGKFYATYWLLLRVFRQLKKAMDISSDLTEVQNVVDVTFQDMSDKVEELSSRSIEDFGMSELTTKTIASRFQAMGTAMSIDKGLIKNANQYLSDQTRGYVELSDSMADVSLTLTKLTADMASFYNMNQKDVAEDLESIFTGQTRPLRTYGLDLTQATLQEWAMKQGMDANIRTMSQAEKTMLRYQYVLANTGAAQGDFARTSNTWANQTRILAQNFEQLGAVIGGVLINAFKPFVQALNNVMGSIINFAQVVSDALGAIFGWTYQTGGGVTQDFELAAGAAEDLEDATGGAAKNAKELNKYIAPWHEVNNMTTDEGSKGGGGGGGGGSGSVLPNADGGNWVQGESLWEKYTSDIDSLYELGSYISNVLTQAMNDIDWESVYQSASNFGQGLALFLNGLITPELFGALGTTIAGSLNTVLQGLDSFGETFDWVNFGESIATGINDFFSTFDFGLLADTLNTWAKGLLDALIAGLEEVDWNNVGIQIGTFLEGIDFIGIAGRIAKAIWTALNAAFDTYKGLFKAAPLEAVLLGLIGLTKLLKTNKITAFANALGKASILVKNFGGAFFGVPASLTALQASFPKLAKAVNVLGASFQSFLFGVHFGDFTGGINAALTNIRNNLTGIQKGVITAVAGFVEFNMVQESVSNLVTGTGSLLGNVAQLSITVGLAATAMYTALGPTGIALAAVVGIAAAFTGITDAIDELAKNSAIGQFSEEISTLSEDVSQKSQDIKDDLSETEEKISSAGAAESQMARDLAKEYEELSGKTSLTADEQQRLKDVSAQLVELVPGLNGYIDEQTGALNVQNETLESLIENMELYAKQQAAEEMLVEAYRKQYEATNNVKRAQDGYNEAVEEFINKNSGMSDIVKNMVKEGDIEGLRDLKDEITDGANAYENFQKHFGDSAKNGRAVSAMIDDLEESMSEYNSALSEATETEKLAADNVEYVKDTLSDVNEELEDNEKTLLDNKKAGEDFKQALSDVNTEFKNMDLNISDKFAESLALDESGMTNSIISAFEKMKSQTQLSTGELSSLFANIAPGISSDFIQSLSEQEPNMQAQISTTMANLSAGAEVPISELKTVFSSIGYDLPEEIIDGFKNQSPSVQNETINLLSKIESGYSLTSGNLLLLFDSLGIDVPDELITSMEDKEADVQQEAINLISQIKNASDSERPELLEELKNLGIDGGDSLSDGLNDRTESVKNSAINLVQSSAKAAVAEALRTGENTFSQAGKNALQGYINELTSQSAITSLIGAGVGMAQAVLQGVDEGQDSHSPSKEMEKRAEYAVEGFNQGLKKNMGSSFDMAKSWISGLVNGLNFTIPTLDLSVDTSKYQVKPPKINPAEISGQVQEAVKYAFTVGGLIDYNRLGEAVYQGQSQAMQENPVQIGDRDIYSATKRQQQREWRRTHRVGWAGID